MDTLKLEPIPELQDNSRNPAQRIKFYESSTGPFVSIALGPSGNGLRISHSQVTELRDWCSEWLKQF